VLFLFGERVHSHSEEIGAKTCPVCNSSQQFSRVAETNYFCIFGLRLLPIERIADYWRCERCRNSFVEHELTQPSQVPVLKQILTYIMLGYGMHDHSEIVQEICVKVAGVRFEDEELKQEIRALDAGKIDVFDNLRKNAYRINTHGKRQIVEGAFLMTHASCEIQHEDRVRINLIGDALGLPLEFIESAIEHVRIHSYYGVRRLLPT